jgi:hypothetical protein
MKHFPLSTFYLKKMFLTYYPQKLQSPPLRTFKLDNHILIEGTNEYSNAIASHPDFERLIDLGVIEKKDIFPQETASEEDARLESPSVPSTLTSSSSPKSRKVKNEPLN